MRVLGLATYPVEAAATRFRMIQFIEPLAEHGIELSVYPFLDSRQYGSLYKRSHWPRTAMGLALASLRRVRELWRARKADVLFVQREAMMFGPPIVEWLSINLHDCPMVLDLDDATYVPYKSPTYGRLGSMRARRSSSTFGAVLFGKDASTQIFEVNAPRPAPRPDAVPPMSDEVKLGALSLTRDVVKFFETGIPPVSNDETLELFAFMDAARRSKEAGGKPIRLQ